MPTLQQWFNEYGESHQHPTNKAIHWICVPVIFFSIVGLMYSIKLPVIIWKGFTLNLAIVAAVLVVIYYFVLSKTIWIGMLLFCLACLGICEFVETTGVLPLWLLSVLLFVLAWVGQFYGHNVEGKKPSFLKDIHFLMIGPAWLMHFIYRKLGIPY